MRRLRFATSLVLLVAVAIALQACGQILNEYLRERFGGDDYEFFANPDSSAACVVVTKADDFTGVVSHHLGCFGARGDTEVEFVCTPHDNLFLVSMEAGPQPHTEDTIEVTYRFDDQLVYRGRWAYSNDQAISSEVVDQMLDGIAAADRFVFQVGSAEVSEIKLSGYTGVDGRRAVAVFRQRCEPSNQ